MEFITAQEEDGIVLAEIRAKAMEPSLEAVGRFDVERVRYRFLNNFTPAETFKLIHENEIIGFYVLKTKSDCLYLDHFYIDPVFQNKNIGSKVITKIKSQAKERKLPIRLGVLRESRANQFYSNHGFVKTHESEFDIYYEYKSSS